jgi:phosphatidylglycerol:prolipoprotein diacylglycerol transferase
MFENMPFPDIDPVFIDLGFFQIRWYGMAYLGGVALGWLYLLRLCKEKYWPDGAPLTREDVEDLMVWSIVGIVVGGRLGYVLFYQPDVFLPDPIRIFYVWQGVWPSMAGCWASRSQAYCSAISAKKMRFRWPTCLPV